MNYYILNINYNKKSEVDYWLDKQKIAPVFYGKCTLEQIRKNVGHKLRPQAYADAKRFVETFDLLSDNNILFSIGNEYIYIFKQAGRLQEQKYDVHPKELVKFFKINLIKKIKIKDCPLVLASIKANRYIQSGTFRDLNNGKYLGNIKALEYIINNTKISVPDYETYLKCLSSLEFETLVAKYFEELGFFVPAYKGGFLKNYDLFCRNTGENDIVFNNETIKPGETLSVQIKLTLENRHLREGVPADCYFCINSEVEEKNIYDWKYLEKNIPPKTKKWLETLLDWVKIK